VKRAPKPRRRTSRRSGRRPAATRSPADQLREALQQQAATSEILRAMSRVRTDAQPVLDAVAESAARLCGANDALILTTDGKVMRRVAHVGAITSVSDERPVTGHTPSGRAIVERRTIHIEDMLEEIRRGDYEEARPLQERTGFRTVLAVPLSREEHVIGVITIRRLEVRAFTATQVELVRTFADQAAMAIETARLFTELQAANAALAAAHAHVSRALEHQTATAEILRAISRSPADVQPVFDAIVRSAVRLLNGLTAMVLRLEDGVLHLAALTSTTPVAGEAVEDAVRANFPRRLSTGGVVEHVIRTRRPYVIADLDDPLVTDHIRRTAPIRGYRSMLHMPMLRDEEIIGLLIVTRRMAGPFSTEEVDLLQTFADQGVIAIESVRLFHETQEKTRQLEAANRHKDEFLASVSHELRTPLNAVIGFSEVLLERMFGELNAKQEEYVDDILASGRHLLSLINDILDLAKIEAGRMELAVETFDVEQAIMSAVALVRERATKKSQLLETRLAPGLGEVAADMRKVKQVLINLLGNAVKFTPEGGRISVHARRLPDAVEISVVDTGVGIAPADHAAVFEEFRQVGDTRQRREGTGLGLALARRFVELHGGRIRLDSAVGAGSTFSFTVPTEPRRC
jgi:signal transduction histidine kinase